MSDLSPEARALLDAARAHDRPNLDERRRMRAAIAAQIAVAAGAGVAASASSAQAASVAPTALSAGLKADAAAKLTWSLASLTTTKGVAVAAAVAALSTTASVAQYARTHPSRAQTYAVSAPPTRVARTSATHAAKDPTPSPVTVVTTVTAPATVTVTVTPREGARPTTTVSPPRASAPVAHAPEAPSTTAPPAMAAWECAREIDRALLRDDNAGALVWVDRCRAQIDGPHGAMLGAREVMALCAEGRAVEASAAARRVLTLDASAQSRSRIERTCARGVLRGEP